MWRTNTALALYLLGCGGAQRVSRTPINVPSHGTRDQIRAALTKHNFCFYVWTEATRKEEYADCGLRTTGVGGHPIVDLGQPTVVVRYHPNGSLDRLQRVENYPSTSEARQRFDELAAARSKQIGAPLADPKSVYGPPPGQPIAWQSWFTRDRSALLSLFVLEQGRRTVVVEEIISVRPAAAPP
jgi:hypothetical protein